SCQGGIDPALNEVPADLFTMKRNRLIFGQVPYHEPAQPFDLLRLQGLDPARIAFREIRELEIRNDVARIQVLQRIRPDQERQVSELLDVVDILQVLIENNLAGTNEQRSVRCWSKRNPVVGSIGRRIIFRSDDHDTASSLRPS